MTILDVGRESGFVTRFAPSPTGRLHLGHAYSALLAHDRALAAGGDFLLRIEDIDLDRCRPDYIEAIYDDLAWLGVRWRTPVRRQSEHFADYQAALDRLAALGVVYPCRCSRADIASSASAPQGPQGRLYPGTCRQRPLSSLAKGEALRLDWQKAVALLGEPLAWHDERRGEIPARPELLGDVVLARKDAPVSYHLAVVVDDALQGVSHVIRGEDLIPATHIHRLLQALLGLPMPVYHHHPLISVDGKRLAKRDGAVSLQQLRAQGATPAEIRAQAGL